MDVTHTEVAATFVKQYFHLLASGDVEGLRALYVPDARVVHWGSNAQNTSMAKVLDPYVSGVRVTVTDFEARMGGPKGGILIFLKGNLCFGDAAHGTVRVFEHDIELRELAANTFGIVSDMMHSPSVVPPPPITASWADETPPIVAKKADPSAVPAMELEANNEEAATPEEKPAVPETEEVAQPAVPEEAAEPEVVEPATEEAPADAEETAAQDEGKPRSFADMLRNTKSKSVPKTIKPVVVTATTDADKKKEEAQKKATKDEADKKAKDEVERKAREEARERQRRSSPKTTIFYDIFVKGMPADITEAEVAPALKITQNIANIKIEHKVDMNSVRRAFVFVKLAGDDLDGGQTKETAVKGIIDQNKNVMFKNSRLTVEKIQEKYTVDGAKARFNGRNRE